MACNTNNPIITCPPFSDKMDMFTNINSTLQMPSYVPVMTILEPINVHDFLSTNIFFLLILNFIFILFIFISFLYISFLYIFIIIFNPNKNYVL